MFDPAMQRLRAEPATRCGQDGTTCISTEMSFAPVLPFLCIVCEVACVQSSLSRYLMRILGAEVH